VVGSFECFARRRNLPNASIDRHAIAHGAQSDIVHLPPKERLVDALGRCSAGGRLDTVVAHPLAQRHRATG
jgi:hypothetical protein